MHNDRVRRLLAAAALLVPVITWTAAPALGQTCAPVNPCGDVDATGAVSTSDALKVLKTAVGQPQELSCLCSEGDGTCEEDLATCTGDLETCTGDLSTCTGNLTNCDDDLGDCETKLDECLLDLSSTNADLASCLSQPVCGNGVVETGEDCENGALLLSICSSFGFAGGELRCGAGCEWDTSRCYESRFEVTSLTTRDHETGLEWERKNGSNGTANYENVHDVDNVYDWTDPGIIVSSPRGVTSTAPDGSLFVYFLAVLNGAEDGEGFAGHADWRIPTFEELSTITAFDPFCGLSPCVAGEELLPNRAEPYWTITTDPMIAGYAKAIDYDGGLIGSVLKTDTAHVRAVRTHVVIED